MLFPEAMHVLGWLAFIASFSQIFGSPVAPQLLGERLAFDLNELPRDVERAASQEIFHSDPRSFAREAPVIGSSSGAFRPYSVRQIPRTGTQDYKRPVAEASSSRSPAIQRSSTHFQSIQDFQTVQGGRGPLLPSHDLDLNSAVSETAEGGRDANKPGNAVRKMAVQDPRVFSGAFFRLTVGLDPDVTRLINNLEIAGAENEVTSPRRDLVHGKIPMPVGKFFATYFSGRKFAKQVLLGREDGARSIFLFPFAITARRYQPIDGLEEHVAAWEIGQVDQGGSFDMRFYGFYPFPRTAFQNLEHSPQSTHESYFFFAPSPTPSGQPLTLVISGVGNEVGINPINGIAMGHQGNPDILALVESGRLQRALVSSTHVPGRYLAVAQEYPLGELGPLKEWIESSGLSQEAFIQRRLIPPQIDELPFVTELRFRKGQMVKIITDTDGKTFMLDFAAGRQFPGLMTMWEFGPELDEGRKRRLLILKAYFATDRASFDHLRPDTVAGLRDARFQYSMEGTL